MYGRNETTPIHPNDKSLGILGRYYKIKDTWFKTIWNPILEDKRIPVKKCPKCNQYLPETRFTASIWCDDCYNTIVGPKE